MQRARGLLGFSAGITAGMILVLVGSLTVIGGAVRLPGHAPRGHANLLLGVGRRRFTP